MALVNFIRQGLTTAAQTINFSVGGTATFNTDYTATFPVGITGAWAASSGSVTIPIGSSQVDVTLAITGDSTAEDDETVVIAITSVAPSIGISTSNSSCVLVIKNDDFVVHNKAVGVGVGATALVGTFSGSTCFTSNNTGTAPANWLNWAVGAVNGNAYTLNKIGTETNIAVSKMVLRTPIAASINTTTLHLNSSHRDINYYFRGNGTGAWDLVYGLASSGSTISGTLVSALAVSTWLDLITEFSPTNLTFYINGVTTVTTNTPFLTSTLGIQFYFRNNSAFAAYVYESGRPFSPSMFPITPANL